MLKRAVVRSVARRAAVPPVLRANEHYDVTLISVVGPPDHPVLRAKWCYRKKGAQCPNKKHQRARQVKRLAA